METVRDQGAVGPLPDGIEGGKLFAPELEKRMTLKPMGRVVKASMLSLAMALGVSACSNDYTVSYVYIDRKSVV